MPGEGAGLMRARNRAPTKEGEAAGGAEAEGVALEACASRRSIGILKGPPCGRGTTATDRLAAKRVAIILNCANVGLP